jgi:histidinol-phosphate aminotransferase
MASAPPAPRLHGGPDSLGVPRHDFSTNSNACGPCPPALAAVQQADASRYPDAGYTALRAQLAAWHGVAPQRVLLAASASEFIFRITAWVARQGGQAVWLPAHGYGDYAHAAQAWGLTQAAQAQDAQLLWCCDPSSPLGAAQPQLGAMAEACPVSVLDRAYEPLRLSGALALSDAQLQRVWQLWTPNKALGLTGVRAAYVIAPLLNQAQHNTTVHPELVEGGFDGAQPERNFQVAQLEGLCPSWPLGAHGVALLQAWVQPEVQAWLQESLDTLRQWKVRQIKVLESMGWTCLTSEANFFCARPDLQDASLEQALQTLRVQGIKLRDAASFGLPGHVRLGVLAPFAQDALQQAWRALGKLRGDSTLGPRLAENHLSRSSG